MSDVDDHDPSHRRRDGAGPERPGPQGQEWIS